MRILNSIQEPLIRVINFVVVAERVMKSGDANGDQPELVISILITRGCCTLLHEQM